MQADDDTEEPAAVSQPPTAATAAAAVAAEPAADQAERLLRTVFVGNLPATIRPKALKKAFSS